MKSIKLSLLTIIAASTIFFSIGTEIAKANDGDVGPPHVSPSEQEREC